MRYKNLIFILLILILIVLIACEKKKEITPIATKELNVTPKEQPKQDNQIKPPEKINPEDLPWNNCAKSFNRDELLEICGLNFASAKYTKEIKSCEIVLKSRESKYVTFIDILSYESSDEAKRTYDSVIKTQGKINNATISNKITKWQELIKNHNDSLGTLRDRVEMYQSKKRARITIIPTGSCKDLNKLTQKVFALV